MSTFIYVMICILSLFVLITILVMAFLLGYLRCYEIFMDAMSTPRKERISSYNAYKSRHK